MDRKAFRLAVFLVLSTLRAGADTYPRQPAIDAQHYDFHLVLRDDTDEIAGDATVEMRFVESGTREFFLDLASAANGKGMTVTEVTSPGGRIQYKHANDRLTITLESAPGPGELRAFRIQYHGVPANGLRIIPNKFGERSFFSENWPNRAHEWLPMIDHPYDKATSEFTITAPARYQVVSNGLLLEETDLGNGQRLTHWKQSVPIASWLNAIGVAQFSSGISRPLQTFRFKLGFTTRSVITESSFSTSRQSARSSSIAITSALIRTRSWQTSRRPASPAERSMQAQSSTAKSQFRISLQLTLLRMKSRISGLEMQSQRKTGMMFGSAKVSPPTSLCFAPNMTRAGTHLLPA